MYVAIAIIDYVLTIALDELERFIVPWKAAVCPFVDIGYGTFVLHRWALDSLDRRSALCVATFAGLYRGQLDRIEANGFDVFERSCRLSAPAKLAVVARGLLR